MKKEDLLLVFEFLATALKQDVVEDKPKDKPYKFEDYFPETKKLEPEVIKAVDEPKIKPTSNNLDDFKEIREKTKTSTEKWVDNLQKENTATEILPEDNKTVKIIKTEAVRVKEIMDMIDGSKLYKKNKPESEIEKVLRDYQRNIASQISLLEANIRDSLATPEQRRLYREFVKMENFKANKDLDRIGYFLDNPGVENPYEAKDEEPKPEAKSELKTSVVGDLKIPVLDDLIKKSTVPQIIKDVMVRPSVPTSVSVKIENGEVKFKEEYKNGLGPNKKFGFDGQEIKE